MINPPRPNRLLSALPILLIIGLYLGLSLSGIRYGLPNNEHPLSYDCDELQWIEALQHVKSAERHHNPFPDLDHPTFYMEVYGAALAAAALTHWIPLHADKDWYSEHLDIFARVYLVGRFLQVVFGVLLLFCLWSVCRTLFGFETAGLATLFMAITPAFVAASTFSQNNMPVTAVTFFSLSCLLMDQYHHGTRRSWLFLGAFLAGVAISTKYSAGAILPVLALRGWQRKERWANAPKIIFFLVFGFAVGNPFAFIFPRSYIEGYLYIQRHITYAFDGLWYRTVFPFVVTLPHAFGLWLALAVALLVGYSLLDWTWNTALWLWSVTFWLGFLFVGRFSTPGRSLALLPPLLIVMTHQLIRLKEKYRPPPPVFYAGISALALATLLPTLSIVAMHRGEPIQAESSDWIKTHIPADRSIGIPRYIYWWSPDVIYQSVLHPEHMKSPYKVMIFDFDAAQIPERRPDYLVVSGAERQSIPPGLHFFDWLDHQTTYRLIKEFPRRVEWHGWRWDRPAYYLNFDDDLWASSISIYERVDGSPSPAPTKP